MARFLGGIFGNTVPSTAFTQEIGGVYNLNGNYYIKREGGWEPATLMEASGGTTATYTDPTGEWKSHTFTSSGSFVVTVAPGDPSLDADFLVQGGGGGSKTSHPGNRQAGSGAGGLLYGPAGTLSATTYPITIGGGGSGGNGGDSTFGGVGPAGQTAIGGGAGGAGDPEPDSNGAPGGCGGGGWWSPGDGGTGTQPSPGLTGITVGKGDGAPGNPSPEYGGCGGGTGGPAPGQGLNNGPGTSLTYRYGPTNAQTYGAGGKASDYPSTPRNANGGANTGDGASGYATGGPGIVVIRYKTSV